MFKKIIEKLYFKQKNNLALNDLATGARNRNYFEKIIPKKYSKKDIYLTIIDMDSLKKLNDEKGHIFADHILKSLVGMLLNEPTIKEVCRYGGDEFVIIHSSETDFKRIRSLFKAITSYTFCFGTIHKESTATIADSLALADVTLYEYKRNKDIPDLNIVVED